MTVKEIHARRKQLEEQSENADRSYYPAHQAQVAAEAELRNAKGARMDALVNEAKGLEADVEGAIAREGTAQTAVEDAKARKGAVSRAREEASRHLQEPRRALRGVRRGGAKALRARRGGVAEG